MHIQSLLQCFCIVRCMHMILLSDYYQFIFNQSGEQVSHWQQGLQMAMNTIGTLMSEFKPESKKIEAYLERVQLFFDANGITDDKQVTISLTAIGSSTYAPLSSLLAPCKQCEKSLQSCPRHFDPKPMVIPEIFHFHTCNQASGESISENVAELR